MVLFKLKSSISPLASIVSVSCALLSGAALADTLVFDITKNSVDDYGEESVQMETRQGNLSIYALGLDEKQLQMLMSAKPGQCLSIRSPNAMQADNGFYVIDDIERIDVVACQATAPRGGAADALGCVLKNGKTVMVSDLYGQPTYQYGSAAKVELTLPGTHTGSKFTKGTQMFAGGGASYLQFTNKNYSYVIYSGIGKGWDFEGLLIYKNDKQIGYQRCKEVPNLLEQVDFDAINAPMDEENYFIGPPG
ncbi:hypothetical protein [Castellaniella sp.]|uniref:hypothetical protein n=1 Tax=Castellaniella sp. TaxID=1955812 RepID=UPI002AFE4A75|nr:hypothetical protein [Castellaniella sp.]